MICASYDTLFASRTFFTLSVIAASDADPEIIATSAISAIQTYIASILKYYEQIHMEKEPLLMLPGPVPMPERVRLAMARQAINHRSAEFGAVYTDCVRVQIGRA